MIICIYFGFVIFGLEKFDNTIGTLTEPQNLGVERLERMSSYHQRQEVDAIIRDTIDKVLILRFDRASDPICLQLDDVVCHSPSPLSLSLFEFLLF